MAFFRKRSSPRILTVKQAVYITPNMIRVTFSGSELEGISEGNDGGNCKIFLPEKDESLDSFSSKLEQNVKVPVRTYTVRSFRKDALEMDIDFVAHGDNGPASFWAMNAKEGSFCGFKGPSSPKMQDFSADWYLLAADMSALPVASAALEAMPRDAKGVAYFEILSDGDQQDLDAPSGIDIKWIVNADGPSGSKPQIDLVKNMDWSLGRVQTCIAGESSTIRELRDFLHNEKKIAKQDTYISGYWKLGLVEDEHQKMKKSGMI